MARVSIDFRFLEIGYELWALDHMLDVFEQQIAYLRDQDTIRTYSRLRHEAGQVDDAERDLEIEMLSERVEVVVPRFLRYPLMVAAWAVYEAGVTEVARNVAGRLDAKRGLSDVGRGGFLARASRYFTEVLNVALDPDSERMKRLEQLATTRHAIAHTNGRVALLKRKPRDSIKKMVEEGFGVFIAEGFIVVDADLARKFVTAVTSSLGDLVSRAKQH